MKRWLLAAIFAALVSSAGAQDNPIRGGTLVVGISQTPRHLNNGIQSGNATAVPGAQLFASPLRFDDKWNPQPYLAEKWELSQDGKALTLHLRKDAFFHDGTPITSEDVAFSVLMVRDNHPFKTMLEPVVKVDTPDAHTAIIRMKTPHPAILLAMSPPFMPIVPKHIYGNGQDIQTNPANTQIVGSGPFKLVEFKPGTHIVLERFDKFFIKGHPYLDKLVFKIVPDSATSLLELERGDIHMHGFFNRVLELERASKVPQLAITREGYAGIGGINWLAFNLKKKPFDDVRVRQAISYAIDRNFIAKVLHRGLSKVATGPIHSASPYYSPNVHTYPLDLKKAEQLLDEAGLKRGSDGVRFRTTVDYYPGDEDGQKKIAEYLKPQLKRIGIDVEVRNAPDFPTWAKRMGAHDFEISMDAGYNWGDPVIGVHRTFLSTNIRNLVWTNTQSYINPKVDALLEEAGQQLDPDKRRGLYAEFQKIVTQDLPVAWIVELPYHTIYNRRVANVPKTIWGLASPMDEVYLRNREN